MRGWFPIPDEEFYDPAFVQLRPAEKLYYWFVVSEFNLYGSFYKPDLEIAAALGLSEVTVRSARRKLQKLGWVSTGVGSRDRGMNLATVYLDVKWARPPKSGLFSQISRHAFHTMLGFVRRGTFSHQDLIVYVYLCHREWLANARRRADFFYVSKRELRQDTNIVRSIECVRRLHDHFSFSNGRHLFTWIESHHKLTFSDWYRFPDPVLDEVSRQVAEANKLSIQKAIQAQRQKRANPQPKMTIEDLPTCFADLYRERYDRGIRIGEEQAEALKELGKKHRDLRVVVKAIKGYLWAETWYFDSFLPTERRPLSSFLRYAQHEKDFNAFINACPRRNRAKFGSAKISNIGEQPADLKRPESYQ